MDLTTGWDFRRKADRQRAEQYVQKEKPLLLIGSPMCTMFSSLQRFTQWNESKQQQWVEDRMHLRFVAGLYRQQMEFGRMFLHEHPAAATSWSLEEIRGVMNTKGVHIVVIDQCMFGLTTNKKGEMRHQREREHDS